VPARLGGGDRVPPIQFDKLTFKHPRNLIVGHHGPLLHPCFDKSQWPLGQSSCKSQPVLNPETIPVLPVLGVYLASSCSAGTGTGLLLPRALQKPIAKNPNASHQDHDQDNRNYRVPFEIRGYLCKIRHLHVCECGKVRVEMSWVGGRSNTNERGWL